MTATTVERAWDLLSLTRRVVALDADERSSGAEWTRERSHSGGIVAEQQLVLGQLCVWAWVIEREPDTADELMRAISTLDWVVAPPQVLGVAASFGFVAGSGPEESLPDDLDDLRRQNPVAEPRLLDGDGCRRAIDLARGITSTDVRERLQAARLAADVVASPALTDDEAGCFVGLLSFAIVIETDPTVRHEQAMVLGIAARHGRLTDTHREAALTAALTDAERSALGAPA